jgi:capsular exopolysaccharide synthesis family protein
MDRNQTTSPPAVSPASREADAVSPRAVARLLRKHWPMLLACLVLATAAAFAIAKSMQRYYQASVLVEINPAVAQPLGEKTDQTYASGMGLFLDSQEYYETQYKILSSDRVLLPVVRDMNLGADLEFLGYRTAPATPISADDVVRALRSRLTIDPVKSSRLAYVRIDDTSPARARKIADAVAAAYIDQNLQTAIDSSGSAVVWLSGQLDHLQHELESNENELYKFKEANELPSISLNDASNMLRIEMQELDTALTHTRTKRAELEARAAALAKIDANNPEEIPSTELLTNAFLQTLRAEYEQAVKARDALTAAGKDTNHPQMKAAEGQLEVTRAALIAQIRNIQGSVARDLDVIKHQEAAETALFETSRRKAVELNMKEIEYHRLDRTREQNEKLYQLLITKKKEADLARMMRVNNIRVVDSAVEPVAPIRPRVSVFLLGGLAIGLLLGLALVWVREQLDNSLKTPDDIETDLGVTFLGLLPQSETETPGAGEPKAKGRRRRSRRDPDPSGVPALVVHDHPMSGFAEAARSIRTNLTFMSPDKPFRTVLVTSAAPAEGKTTTACSLAIALAQAGQRVCIVDCDLRRPRLHRIFDRVGDAGVTNVLVGDATIAEVAKPTVVGNLWCIPAGSLPPNPADVLHSTRFSKFLKDLSEHFDRVIVDSPPLVAVTDSAIVSTVVDGTIVVIRSFRTARQVAQQGLRSLRDVDAAVIGVVLNAVDFKRHEYSYYYHYYYYKRTGYGPVPAPDEGGEDRPASPPN